jgi:HK97 family phage prohead protease
MRVPKIERKIEYFPIIGGEIKATSDIFGIVEGYLNYIGNIDYGDDRTMKGAFQKTLKDSYARKSAQNLDFLWPYLFNHDYSQLPPGGIFEASEDRKGLYIKTQFNLDIQMGRELYSSFKMGTMKKQSMGYKAIQVDWVKEDGKSIRNLLEVAVMEGSAVVFPMNDMAQVDHVKNDRRNFYMPNKPLPKQAFPALTKDYAASYAEATQQDWVSDLWNLWYPLKNEIIVAFQTGDTPVEDVQAALKQFGTALIAYVQRGVELDMTECLQPDDDNGMMPGMYMSAEDNPETKKLSADGHAKLMKSVDGAIGHLKEAKSELSRQRANALQGYQVYASDDPPQQKQDDVAEPDDEATTLNKMRAMVDDIASKLQFQNADHGI